MVISNKVEFVLTFGYLYFWTVGNMKKRKYVIAISISVAAIFFSVAICLLLIME